MFLRQSTAQSVQFGPCLDIGDGVTEETALTLAQADMRLSKDGGAYAQKSAAGNATHDSDGYYSTTFSTTDTDTVGILKLNVHQPANMFPVWENYYVVEEEIYDAFFAASAGTLTLPGQEAPSLTPTYRQAWGWAHKMIRNRKSQTGSLWRLFADDEITVDAKATVSDVAGTAIKQEIETGP